MEWFHLHMEAIGFAAAILTTTAFVPQVIRTWRVRGEELSWLMLLLFGSGVGLWLVYGFLRASLPMIIANGVTGVLILIILLIKLSRLTERPKASDSNQSGA
jgi:MtN3 and saliva related transmembrane protein